MVIDASVILKWFIEESDSYKANDIKNNHVLGLHVITVPDIAIYEIGNVLRYKREFSVKEIAKSLDVLYDLDLNIISPYPEIIKSSAEIARQSIITFYDAFYIALAKDLNSEFITADKKLYEKTRNLHFIHLF